MSRITNDVNIVKAMVSTAVTSIIKDSFTITALLFVVFYRDWKLACWAIGVFPIVFYPVVYFGRKVRRVSTGCQEAMAGLNSFLHETFAGNKIVKTFCMENLEKKILDNINLSAKHGEIIALVGASGGGKTSLVNLIPRFFDVTEGSVFIDHINVRDISLKSLRSQIGIVTQEPILFNESIKDNIRYGNREASDREIVQAAKAAFAYDFIEKFPEKFDTEIGELGSRLSGGERQRICIARALLKNASILILDEATSALDAEAERLVQKALSNLMEGRTTFVIAHRLSTIRHANRILVLSDGKIVEEGTHEDLLRRKGEYFKLYKMQFEKKYISLPLHEE